MKCNDVAGEDFCEFVARSGALEKIGGARLVTVFISLALTENKEKKKFKQMVNWFERGVENTS